MTKIVVIGGKGTAINIAEHIVDANRRFGAGVEFLGFAIDDESLGNSINGFPVLCRTGQLKQAYPDAEVKFIFSLYKPDRMKERVALLRSYGIAQEKFATFCHPSAYVSPSSRIGHGAVILSQASINSSVTIGNFSIVNAGVVIEHDTEVGNHAFIAACACIGARVKAGEGVFVGLNSTVREELEIGDYAYVGMNSNVISSVPSNAMVYGNPAKVQA